MLLAEGTDVATGTWAAVGGMSVMLIGALGVQINNWRKDKRDAQQEESKTKLFERMANSNDAIVEKLARIHEGQQFVCRYHDWSSKQQQ